MSAEVETTIEKLRLHFGVQNDVDLGRKLRIAKSTISSWRARGAVPNTYQQILSGRSHQLLLVPMTQWAVEEKTAFNLALFRFVRANVGIVSKGDYRENLDLFQRGSLLGVLAIECQKDLSRLMDERGYDITTAFAMQIHDDLEQGEDAIKRTQETLQKLSFSF